jgi:hypothetical protein
MDNRNKQGHVHACMVGKIHMPCEQAYRCNTATIFFIKIRVTATRTQAVARNQQTWLNSTILVIRTLAKPHGMWSVSQSSTRLRLQNNADLLKCVKAEKKPTVAHCERQAYRAHTSECLGQVVVSSEPQKNDQNWEGHEETHELRRCVCVCVCVCMSMFLSVCMYIEKPKLIKP